MVSHAAKPRRSAADNPAELYGILLGMIPPSDDRVVDVPLVSTPDLTRDVNLARNFPEGFLAWARHWQFKNRETGAVLTFRNLWPGQERFADKMMTLAWIFALKAGKLGFTELECCWDGYVAWARRNSRVHLFSKEQDAAKEMLTYVKFGLAHMEPAFGIHFLDQANREIDSDHVASQILHMAVYPPGQGRDASDLRSIQAYATAKFPAIDKTAQHTHVDEWAHMERPGGVWGSIQTTVSPDNGTVHIVTRGAGESKEVEDTWKAAVDGGSKLIAFFEPWSARPDRDQAWLEAEAATAPTLAALQHFAPETAEDAFLGDNDAAYVPIELWDACFDPTLAIWIPDPNGPQVRDEEHGRWVGNLQPGDGTTLVLGVDAGVSHDTFAVVAVSRHPVRHADPAIRLVKSWRPEDFVDEVIDFATVESWIRTVCQGGCHFGHPLYAPWHGGGMCARLRGQAWSPGECPACRAIDEDPAHLPQTAKYMVFEMALDPWQLSGMAQSLRRDGVVYCREFSQAGPRLEADRMLYDMIISGRLGHPGDYRLRDHVLNAKAKTSRDDESRMRIVKRAAHRKIDLVVAASMGVAEAMRLSL